MNKIYKEWQDMLYGPVKYGSNEEITKAALAYAESIGLKMFRVIIFEQEIGSRVVRFNPEPMSVQVGSLSVSSPMTTFTTTGNTSSTWSGSGTIGGWTSSPQTINITGVTTPGKEIYPKLEIGEDNSGEWINRSRALASFQTTPFGHDLISGKYASLDRLHEEGKVYDTSLSHAKKMVSLGVWGMELGENTIKVWLRPKEIKFDDKNRLHCGNGPAIVWKNGSESHYWHGVLMTKDEIENPNSLKSKEIMHNTNIEKRRALIEIYGYERLLADVEPIVIDKDVDGANQPRRLLVIKVPNGDDSIFATQSREDSFSDIMLSSPSTFVTSRSSSWFGGSGVLDEHIVLVEVTCPSTEGKYFLRVPPTMKTCAAAVAWGYGETKETYRPLKEA